MPERVSPPIAPRMDRGSATTDAAGEATVTFARPFTRPPRVFLNSIDAAAKGIVLDVVSVSTTGFTVKARQTTGLTSGAVGDHSHFISTGVYGPVTAFSPTYLVKDHAGSITEWAARGEWGAVGSESTGGHAHAVDASPLAVDFAWLAIEA